MVQVLERNSGSKETICSNCGSRLRYMPSERREKPVNHNYLGDFDVVSVIECPVCQCDTQVS